MSNDNSFSDGRSTPDTAAERELRGSALAGSDQKDAPDHADQVKARNPDATVQSGDDTETLYNDGLDIEENPDPLYGTHGSSGIKP